MKADVIHNQNCSLLIFHPTFNHGWSINLFYENKTEFILVTFNISIPISMFILILFCVLDQRSDFYLFLNDVNLSWTKH